MAACIFLSELLALKAPGGGFAGFKDIPDFPQLKTKHRKIPNLKSQISNLKKKLVSSQNLSYICSTEMAENEKSCLECGTLVKGRADKRFCDDQCRSAYNNKVKKERLEGVKSINNALMQNREILSKLVDEETGKGTTSFSKLIELNFNFKYHTHIYKTKKGQEYIFCYEYGYLKLENDRYFIVKNDRD